MNLPRILLANLLCLPVFAHCLLAQDAPPKQLEQNTEKAELKPVQISDIEKQFSADLSGSSLVGYFTVDDAEDALKPKADRYRLGTVTKVKDDQWLFTYSHQGIPIPLMLKVLWAGKTPVLTLDDFTIAGMGTFSARVMFHGDRYAGTWQHGQKGGLMFGRIEKAAKPGKPAPNKPAPPKQDE